MEVILAIAGQLYTLNAYIIEHPTIGTLIHYVQNMFAFAKL